MLENIHSIMLKKNSFSSSADESVNNDKKDIASESVFKKMTKNLLSKEMEFDNISKKEKKNNDNTLSKNFFMNYLIDIFYRQDMCLKKNMYCLNKNHDIQKKNWIIM